MACYFKDSWQRVSYPIGQKIHPRVLCHDRFGLIEEAEEVLKWIYDHETTKRKEKIYKPYNIQDQLTQPNSIIPQE